MAKKDRVERLRLSEEPKVDLDAFDTGDSSAFPGTKAQALAESRRLTQRLEQAQELLYAAHGPAVLVVLQGLDTAGKDGTIRHVFQGVNPQGVRVARFRVPTEVEYDHDFLWRVHPETPGKGEIVIFNRSHYEDVLAARVDGRVPKDVWKQRYRSINEFERTLVKEGTTVIKFFLAISRAEQRRRLEARLHDPTKHWKFSAGDAKERRKWPQYVPAIEEMLERTSTRWAPWYLVPADKKWFRDWVVSRVLVRTLEGFDLKWPGLPPGLAGARID